MEDLSNLTTVASLSTSSGVDDALTRLLGEQKPNMGTSSCFNSSYELRDWIQYSLIPALTVIIVFSFLDPRKRLWPKCCKMRPSIASPANLIDSYEDRWSFGCAFAAMSTCVIILFTGEWFFNPDLSGVPEMFRGTVQIFIVIVNVLEISIAYYPLLLCLSTDHEVLGNAIGLIYTIAWGYYYVATRANCQTDDGLETRVITAVLGPVYFCYMALFLRFIYGLSVSLRQMFCPEKESSVNMVTIGGERDDEFAKTHFYTRVKYLLTPPKPGGEVSLSVRLRRKFIEDAPGFKFSRRCVCTFILSALTTYQLGLVYVMSLSSVWESANRTLAIGGDLYNIFAKVNETDAFLGLKTFFDIAEDTFWPTCYFAIATTIGYSLHMQLCYRKHTLRLWRGNKDFCPSTQASFSSLVVANLRFTGYHIGFSVWGFFILQVLSWTLVFFIVYFIIYPLTQAADTLVLSLLKNYWLSFLVGFVLYYAQVFLSQLAFLQSQKDKSKITTYLSLDNRRAYNVTVYITLFMNVILGLLSCLMRIFKAVFFGVLFIGRIDRSTLMRGWELWDPGFKAYIGFLQLEVAHTHPVVVTFCHLLWKSIESNKKSALQPTYKTFEVVEEAQEDAKSNTGHRVICKRARNRWFVALTLMRNRALTVSRVPVLPELQQVREDTRDATDDSTVKVSPDAVVGGPTSVTSETEL
ncbi:stimulated by retinoic acid gene 6 protein-like isoform X2 [Acanthaster planci]|uniref:Stimulated by retinoic acid gene 6 protein-like isoform X2 n=1 Tax=Acanthaster planci TaxID=133434 RepID=A0A8B7ZI85_ACAPL|nr:stimulated by retinoic acid gene 6 protein-like isoform X2 [Acanthaster planci]